MTCGLVRRAGHHRRAPCVPPGYDVECRCIIGPDHDGPCMCPCGLSPPRCDDCSGDPCPCGRPGLVAVEDATLALPDPKEPTCPTSSVIP